MAAQQHHHQQQMAAHGYMVYDDSGEVPPSASSNAGGGGGNAGSSGGGGGGGGGGYGVVPHSPPPPPKGVCRDFWRTGTCDYTNCHFPHVTPQSYRASLVNGGKIFCGRCHDAFFDGRAGLSPSSPCCPLHQTQISTRHPAVLRPLLVRESLSPVTRTQPRPESRVSDRVPPPPPPTLL